MAVPDRAIDGVADENDFSGVVQVARGGDVLYERARGLADRAHEIENTLETQFAIASGTKGLTAAVIMSLVVDGTLAIETSVRELVGDDLELVDPAVTVGHLVAHTSGIGDYLDEDTLGDVGDYELPVPIQQLACPADYLAVLRGHPPKFAAGERFEYCNGGYVILALVAEVASGASYYDLVTERVLAPAGMQATSFLRSDQLPGSAAIGYLPADDGWRTNWLHLPVRGAGDGGAYSTLGDIAAFWEALFAGTILPRAIVDDMARAHHDVPAERKRYGLGLWLRPDRDTVMLEGYDAGVSFRTAYDQPSRLTYTVISNTASGAWPLVSALDEMLPDLAEQ